MILVWKQLNPSDTVQLGDCYQGIHNDLSYVRPAVYRGGLPTRNLYPGDIVGDNPGAGRLTIVDETELAKGVPYRYGWVTAHEMMLYIDIKDPDLRGARRKRFFDAVEVTSTVCEAILFLM
jgi:hypothetical protein